MRILFLGAGDIAVPTFKSLLESEYDVVGLVTQPDRPVGRKQVMQASPIKQAAIEAGIPVDQPENLKTEEALETLTSYRADVFVVMAYGQILSQRVIDLPKLACINLHASLLPKYRGASCIQAAILAGDSETGITAMHVVKKLDAGDVILRKSIAIGEDETAGELHDRLADLAPAALEKALKSLESGEAGREVQNDDESSYAPKLGRGDGVIDWSEPAFQIDRKIRALHPWPGTSTHFTDSKGRQRSLKVKPPVTVMNSEEGLKAGDWSKTQPGFIQCGEGGLKLEIVQPEGSKQMEVCAFLNGNPQVFATEE